MWVDETQDCPSNLHQVITNRKDLSGDTSFKSQRGSDLKELRTVGHFDNVAALLTPTVRARMESTLVHAESLFNGLLRANGPYNLQVISLSEI